MAHPFFSGGSPLRFGAGLLALTLGLPLAWGKPPVKGHSPEAEPPALPSSLRDDERKLVWSLCAEGMSWNGRACEGQAQQVDRAGAFQLATQRRERDQQEWRLPSVKELQRLSQLMAKLPAAQRPQWGKGNTGLVWSDSVRVNNAAVNQYRYDNVAAGVNGGNVNRLSYLQGWAVNVPTGSAEEVPKKTTLPVLLVRSLLPSDTAPAK